MAKSNTSAAANSTVAPAAPAKTATAAKPKTAEAPKMRALSAKARAILASLVTHGALSRSQIVEKTEAVRISGPDTTSYLGSLNEETRNKWDRVAMNPDDKSWNHVSLIGRGLVSYKKATVGGKNQTVFEATKEGVAEHKKLVEAAKK